MQTDFHSHILPGVDDGSHSLEQSLSMLSMEAEQGITRVVATPHFYARHDDPQRFLARRAAAAEELFRALEAREDLPTVELGAEVHYFSGISDCEALSRLTIGKKQCILIEMPEVSWTDKMYRELEGIYTKQGLTPVIAHIDRYIRPLTYHKVFRELEQLPVWIQANAELFQDRHMAGIGLRLLRRDRIHLLGSDCHDLKDRAPNLGTARETIRGRLGEAVLERIAGYERQILD